MVSLVGSAETVGVDQKDAGAAAWAVVITADDANDALSVTVTEAAGGGCPLACGDAEK